MATFHAVSATNKKTEERWMQTGSKAELKALLKLKLKDWGGESSANVEWTEHELPVTYLDDET